MLKKATPLNPEEMQAELQRLDDLPGDQIDFSDIPALTDAQLSRMRVRPLREWLLESRERQKMWEEKQRRKP